MHNKVEATIHVCRQPKRYRLVLLNFVGLLAPAYFIPPTLTTLMDGPRLLTVSVAVALTVVLMSYVIMPLLTRVAASWLFAAESANSQRQTKANDS